jgi:hypothetical protein
LGIPIPLIYCRWVLHSLADSKREFNRDDQVTQNKKSPVFLTSFSSCSSLLIFPEEFNRDKQDTKDKKNKENPVFF